jgi:hypothetical protein
MGMEMLGTLDVPDVFATTTKIESAGGGCIRVYNCIVKDGTLVPVGNAVVFPAGCLLKLAESAQDFARRVALLEMGEAVTH